MSGPSLGQERLSWRLRGKNAVELFATGTREKLERVLRHKRGKIKDNVIRGSGFLSKEDCAFRASASRQSRKTLCQEERAASEHHSGSGRGSMHGGRGPKTLSTGLRPTVVEKPLKTKAHDQEEGFFRKGGGVGGGGGGGK